MAYSSKPEIFTETLLSFKSEIDSDIQQAVAQLKKETLQNYTAYSRVAVDAYVDILSRGGKRIRGALVMAAYEMLGGNNKSLALQAARAIEMTHAYILIIDDIQDRSPVRRGGPTAHVMLADYHRSHNLAGSPEHFGISIALNAALTGAHLAQYILATLDTTDAIRLQALQILNQTIVTTAHGQTNDIFNEAVATVSEHDADMVLEWKTAHYTFLNPLMIGMTLAGADESAARVLQDYALYAGRAFQITDDILGTFGSEFESGKSPLDDIKEGKRTLLVTYALEHAPKADQYYLLQMLGNEKLSQAEFDRCKEILVSCGALEYVSKRSVELVELAVASLENAASVHDWNPAMVQFLRELVLSLPSRHA
jgi:geranylgeranyl pyrophosphate synthase